MFTTIITDCWGENEKGRQIARYNSFGLGPSDIIGVTSNFSIDTTIEGGANLIDIMDSTEGKKGVIVLNVAPRGNKKDGENGNKFCFFYLKNTLVISSVKGYCLSFIKKFNLTKEVKVVELSEVLNYAIYNKLIDKTLSSYIVNTQFRSFDFVPRLASWIINNQKIPFSTKKIVEFPTVNTSCVWHIDAFGNAKTTITNIDLGNKITKLITNIGELNYYTRLKDLPYGETAFYIGSSGINNNRFLEIACQGVPGSAQKALNLKIGDTIEIK